jgi:hypothetical protein
MAKSSHNSRIVAVEAERESSRQTAELAAFRRMLLVSEGTFSLSFAVYNTRRLRDELIGQLIAEFPGIAVVKLPPKSTDPFAVVREEITTIKPRAVFVLDLEASLSLQGAPSPALRSLNASRELWERFACPVVFWLAEYAAARVATQAVDFWRYRSHTFEFTAPTLEAGEWRSESFPGYDMIAGLPYDEKRFRRAELEQRLADAGTTPSESMLPHVLDWMYELAVLHEVFGNYDASEKLKRHAIRMCEQKYGEDALKTATAFNNLAQLLHDTNRLAEAEPLMRRCIQITEQFRASTGHAHPKSDLRNENYRLILTKLGVEKADIDARLDAATNPARLDAIADTP